MFNVLITKDMVMNGITIKNVPVKQLEDKDAPGITKGVASKIQDLVWKANALKIDTIDFSYNLGKE